MAAMARRVFTLIHLVHQSHYFLDQEALLIVTQALVISCLDYYTVLCIGLPICLKSSIGPKCRLAFRPASFYQYNLIIKVVILVCMTLVS